MKWISFLSTLVFITHVGSARADAPPSYRQQHPLAWMHALPTGEQPGWSRPWWFNFEVSAGNVWNAPLIMNDKRNGREYQYMADYEQANAIVEFGRGFGEWLAVSLEVPYAYRSGGIMDHVIDAFHVLIGNRRFHRNHYPKYQDIFSVETDGVDYYSEDNLADGISNLRLKLKFWLLHWQGTQKESCPCGVSVSSQTKFPVQDEKLGGTTGDVDQSYLLHVGIPLFSASGLWLTAGYTKLGDNPAMNDWPRKKEILMYEGNFDFSLTQNWGLVMSARAESPFLDIRHLDFYDTSSDPKIMRSNRSASGWNSLVYWRGTESIGVRYRAQGGNLWQLLIAEDWGIGPYDAIDDFYSNGAADINFIMQTQIKW